MKVTIEWTRTTCGTTELDTDTIDGLDRYADEQGHAWGDRDSDLDLVLEFLEAGMVQDWSDHITARDLTNSEGSAEFELQGVR